MKKLLLVLILLPYGLCAQSFSSSNEAPIGSLLNLYLCDSNASSLASVVGNNVTWDYGQLAGVFGVTKDVEMLDASLNSNFTSFTGSTKVISVGGTLETFFSSGAGRTSQGFVFNEVSLGSVVASWNLDQQNLMNYPFALGNMVTDNFSGSITSSATGTVPSTGSSVSVYDGFGTLLLPGGNSYANVSRYHLKDSSVATVFGTAVSFVRNVYEYYDLAAANPLPIFMMVNVSVISALLNNSSTLVLSKDAPTTFVGIDETSYDNNIAYPNPAQGEIQISNLAVGTEYQVYNHIGQLASQGSYEGSINLNTLQKGLYFVKFNGITKTFSKI